MGQCSSLLSTENPFIAICFAQVEQYLCRDNDRETTPESIAYAHMLMITVVDYHFQLPKDV